MIPISFTNKNVYIVEFSILYAPVDIYLRMVKTYSITKVHKKNYYI